jgi:hypothetical protein
MFPGLNDDVTSSLGSFQIQVADRFVPLAMSFGSAFDPDTKTLTSPTLHDPATRIGRSDPLTVGDFQASTMGVPVGLPNVPGLTRHMISTANFAEIPPGFSPPNTTREVITEVRTFNLTGGGMSVMAGHAAPDLPLSVGLVQSKDTSGNPNNDFPARSVFNIYAEVKLPVNGLLDGIRLSNSYKGDTSNPLVITNGDMDLTRFPPRVIYIHNGTAFAVPIFFLNSNPDPDIWKEGDLFGYLTLAGHGIGFNNTPEDVAKFKEFLSTVPPLSPIPEPSSLSLLALGGGLLAGFALLSRRRRA